MDRCLLDLFFFNASVFEKPVKNFQFVDFNDEGCIFTGDFLLINCDLKLSLSAALCLLEQLNAPECFFFLEYKGVSIIHEYLFPMDGSVKSLESL